MNLTVCFLTRNHGDCLGRALQSVPSDIALTLVGDTGSTDGTVSVAASEASQVVNIPWHQHFGQACNDLLQHVTTEWVLWLNPDEQLVPDTIEHLQEATQSSALFAAFLPVKQLTKPERLDQFTLGWEPRLFRRRPAVRYAGRVHPRFETPLEHLALSEGKMVGRVHALIERHAYRNVPSPDKYRWVAGLLEASLQDEPENLGYLIELGQNLRLLNDSRAEEVLVQAAKRVALYRGAAAAPDPMVGPLLEAIIQSGGSSPGCPISPEEARQLAYRWFPNTPPLLWSIAEACFQAADYAGAVEPLRRLIELGQTGQYDSPGFDPDIIGTLPLLNLGLCYLQLKNWTAAKMCLAPLVGHPVHGARCQRLVQQCLHNEKSAGS